MDSVTLTGKDVYKVSVNDEAAQYKSGPNEGKEYYRARYNGSNFTVTPGFYDAFKGGKVAELTLTQTQYEVEDPNNAGEKMTRQGWGYDGHMTWEQLKALTQNEGEVKVIENKALAAIKLSDEKIKQLEEAI